MRILVTGAAGRIGSVLGTRLAADHELRGVDLHEPTAGFAAGVIVGDCAKPAVADAAVRGMDAVVHLAGIASETSLPAILRSHVETTAALLDAMVQHDVRRMVYASSNHAVGMTPRVARLAADASPRPDTFYGVGKVGAESLLSLYADRHGISSVAIRIGSFLEHPETRRHLATWLSYDDCVRMVQAAVSADLTGLIHIWGISANSDAWWDLAAGRALGYHPADDAADLGDLPRRENDDVEAERVGGTFATPALDRRPFDEETP